MWSNSISYFLFLDQCERSFLLNNSCVVSLAKRGLGRGELFRGHLETEEALALHRPGLFLLGSVGLGDHAAILPKLDPALAMAFRREAVAPRSHPGGILAVVLCIP